MEHQRSHGGKEWQNIVEGCEIEGGFMDTPANLVFVSIERLTSDKAYLRVDSAMSAIKDRVRMKKWGGTRTFSGPSKPTKIQNSYLEQCAEDLAGLP